MIIVYFNYGFSQMSRRQINDSNLRSLQCIEAAVYYSLIALKSTKSLKRS
jgi:hypothetical protein